MTIDREGQPTVSFGVSAEHGDLPLLTDTLDAIEALAAESGQEVVVVLDEVQRIVVEHGLTAERQLRSTVQGHSHVGYIFAGSATRLLSEITIEPESSVLSTRSPAVPWSGTPPRFHPGTRGAIPGE